MKKDPRFYHVPGWFEYVSALGASLLVEATGKLFRNYKPYDPKTSPDVSDEEDELDSSGSESSSTRSSSSLEGPNSIGNKDSVHSTKHSQGRPLLTLEYLVSTLSIFEVTKPHDAIYALLAIARDTTPLADGKTIRRQSLEDAQGALEGFIEKKRYKVDYDQPFADVCKEFVKFCIEESKDPTRALDIICRPWAPSNTDKGKRENRKRKSSRHRKKHKRRTAPNPPSNHHGSSCNENAPPMTDPALLHATQIETPAEAPQKPKSHPVDDLPLPSWIPSLSGAAFAMIPLAGADTLKMGRKNADALVGLPPSSQALERNYNAAETKGVDRKSLRFAKRLEMRHWSMYVKGFVLNEITETHASSQNGAIPNHWAEAGGWHDVHNSDPPNDFWRTLVADRGRDGKNPPVYYSRACKESFHKGGWGTGSVDLSKLIHNERCSVIAQFCRRVQAVIWNRCLIMTRFKRLGLSGDKVQRGDLICILHGCSVPVVLRRHKKSKEAILQEWTHDLNILGERMTARYRKRLKYRKEYQESKKQIYAQFHDWEETMWDEYLKDLRVKSAEKVEMLKKLQGKPKQGKGKSPGQSKERNITDAQPNEKHDEQDEERNVPDTQPNEKHDEQDEERNVPDTQPNEKHDKQDEERNIPDTQPNEKHDKQDEERNVPDTQPNEKHDKQDEERNIPDTQPNEKHDEQDEERNIPDTQPNEKHDRQDEERNMPDAQPNEKYERQDEERNIPDTQPNEKYERQDEERNIPDAQPNEKPDTQPNEKYERQDEERNIPDAQPNEKPDTQPNEKHERQDEERNITDTQPNEKHDEQDEERNITDTQQNEKHDEQDEERNITDAQQNKKQDRHDFQEIAKVLREKSEYIVRLATREDYFAWLAKKRGNKQIPVEKIEIWDKHVFYLELRFGRSWKTIWKEKVALRAAERAPKAAQKKPKMSSPTEAVSEDVAARHRRQFEEPDWEKINADKTNADKTNADNLLLQQKWYHYEFLGECYVHGMMDGGAMEYQNREGILPQVFELR